MCQYFRMLYECIAHTENIENSPIEFVLAIMRILYVFYPRFDDVTVVDFHVVSTNPENPSPRIFPFAIVERLPNPEILISDFK